MIIRYLLIQFVLFSLLLVVYTPAEEDEDNPHENMVDDQFVCLDCHTEIPKSDQKSPTYFLVDKPSENCLGCHDETQHTGSKEHLGKEAEPLPGDENGDIACFTCHDPHPQGVIEGRAVYNFDTTEYNEKFIEQVIMPQLEEELHQKLITNNESVVLLREPGNKLCANCHQNIKPVNWREYTLWNKFTDIFSY